MVALDLLKQTHRSCCLFFLAEPFLYKSKLKTTGFSDFAFSHLFHFSLKRLPNSCLHFSPLHIKFQHARAHMSCLLATLILLKQTLEGAALFCFSTHLQYKKQPKKNIKGFLWMYNSQQLDKENRNSFHILTGFAYCQYLICLKNRYSCSHFFPLHIKFQHARTHKSCLLPTLIFLKQTLELGCSFLFSQHIPSTKSNLRKASSGFSGRTTASSWRKENETVLMYSQDQLSVNT